MFFGCYVHCADTSVSDESSFPMMVGGISDAENIGVGHNLVQPSPLPPSPLPHPKGGQNSYFCFFRPAGNEGRECPSEGNVGRGCGIKGLTYIFDPKHIPSLEDPALYVLCWWYFLARHQNGHCRPHHRGCVTS